MGESSPRLDTATPNDSKCFTSEELLLVVEAVSLDGGQLVFVLLDDLLQIAVQILLLLLKELLFLEKGRRDYRSR